MYGEHMMPFTVEEKDIAVKVEQTNGKFHYKRKCTDQEKEQIILLKKGAVQINPVEPLQIPQKLTKALMIEFETPISMPPKQASSVYLTFPIEIGILIKGKNGWEPLDVFSLVKPKYTLYGTPSEGTLCKYWKSEIFNEVPVLSRFKQGVMSLSIKNETDQWVTITRAIFNAFGMKLFYSEHLVSMKSVLRVSGKQLAETEFENSPLQKGMKPSFELYRFHMMTVSSKKFIMEGDL